MAIAVRKIDPSRALKRMEGGAKKYPKFVHQNGRAASNARGITEEGPASYRDHAFQATPPAPRARTEEKSGLRRRVTPETASPASIAPMPEAPTVPIPTPEAAPMSEAPPSTEPGLMRLMSNSAFEELLAEPKPEPIRRSVRPTVRLGSPAMMVMPPPEVLNQKLASLLSHPHEACALPRPEPLLPSVTKTKPSRWTAWVAVAAGLLVAGGALFGGAQYLKSASQKVEAPKAAAAPEPAPILELDEAMPAPKKALPTGPSQANAALASGDIDTAAKLFEELADHPSTRMDGLMGLAEVSRAHGDLAGARARYRDMLTESPQYFPAKLGEADATWDLGEKDAARRQYGTLVASYPSRVLPSRVHDRAKRAR